MLPVAAVAAPAAQVVAVADTPVAQVAAVAVAVAHARMVAVAPVAARALVAVAPIANGVRPVVQSAVVVATARNSSHKSRATPLLMPRCPRASSWLSAACPHKSSVQS